MQVCQSRNYICCKNTDFWAGEHMEAQNVHLRIFIIVDSIAAGTQLRLILESDTSNEMSTASTSEKWNKMHKKAYLILVGRKLLFLAPYIYIYTHTLKYFRHSFMHGYVYDDGLCVGIASQSLTLVDWG